MTAFCVAAFMLAAIGIVLVLKLSPEQIQKDISLFFEDNTFLKDKAIAARGRKRTNKLVLELDRIRRALTETGKEKQFYGVSGRLFQSGRQIWTGVIFARLCQLYQGQLYCRAYRHRPRTHAFH